jgi:hypothetical protein
LLLQLRGKEQAREASRTERFAGRDFSRFRARTFTSEFGKSLAVRIRVERILYMIGQGQGTESQPLKQLMDRLSLPTGGRTVSTISISALERSLSDLFEEDVTPVRARLSGATGVSDDRWRETRVSVDGNHRVRARRGSRTSRSEAPAQ